MFAMFIQAITHLCRGRGSETGRLCSEARKRLLPHRPQRFCRGQRPWHDLILRLALGPYFETYTTFDLTAFSLTMFHLLNATHLLF